MRSRSGFHADLLNPHWFISEPPDVTFEMAARGEVHWAASMERVYSRTLADSVEMSAYRAGVVVIDFSGMPTASPCVDEHDSNHFKDAVSALAERVRVLNSFSICLHSAHMSVDRIDPGSCLITSDTMFHAGPDRDAELGGVSGPGVLHLNLFGLSRVNNALRHGVVSFEVIDAAGFTIERALRDSTGLAIPSLALLNEALCAHKQHNFPVAVVAAWAICERLQSKLWTQYVESRYEENGVRVNRARRDWLQGPEFTASIVTTVLELAGDISTELRVALDAARRARNHWLHRGVAPDMNASELCVDAARKMIALVLDIELGVGMGLCVSL